MALRTLLLVVALLPVALFAQKNKDKAPKERPAWKDKELRYEDCTYEPQIGTVQLYSSGDELNYPFLVLGQAGVLTLEFDDLKREAQQYSYTVIHCDANWQQSMLLQTEYYNHFFGDLITDYRSSQNTLVPYIHYRVQLPKEGTRFLASGNYLVKVYRGSNDRDLILTRRFVVMEEGVRIVPDLATMPAKGTRLRFQSVNFNLYPTRLPIRDPATELNIQILQNWRWDNKKSGLRPAYFYPDHWEYRFDSANDFPGGNEFRWFDLRDITRKMNRIQRFRYTDSCTYVELMADQPRSQLAYFTEPDFNGQFYIGLRQYPLADIEADYLYTEFSLKLPYDFQPGELYIRGAFSGWQLQPQYRLQRIDDVAYLTLPLKQGIYNYEYVLKTTDGQVVSSPLEGSFNETENAYTILVYYRLPTDRADRLIGLYNVNSR